MRISDWSSDVCSSDLLSDLGFRICAAASPIIAVKLPSEEAAVFMWNALMNAGVYVNLALPPDTPDGSCLLPCSLSAAHTPPPVQRVCEAFGQAHHALQAWTDPQSAAERGPTHTGTPACRGRGRPY